MRHKYSTTALVLSRASLSEANSLLTLLTADVGLVRARAQGLRTSGAKLSSSLPTFAESDVILVRGVEGWRIAGAVLRENWFLKIDRAARIRAVRVSGLLLRLVAGESADPSLFETVRGFFSALARGQESEHDAIECLAALRVLSLLGLDAGEIPGNGVGSFDPTALLDISTNRSAVINRINRGIEASGL